MAIRTVATAGILALLAPAVAQATGNVDCSIEEPGFGFTLEALYSYGGTGEMFQSHARIDLTDPRRPPGNWTFDMDGSVLVQQWLVGDEFRALIHRRREGGDMVLDIRAKRTAPEDIAFDGTYKLTLGPSDGSLYARTGEVACSKG